MSVTNADFIESLRNSRKFLLRHLAGLTPEQADWKPYRECKNVIETLQHLIIDDRMALESMRTLAEPNYEACVIKEFDYDRLLELLETSHEELMIYLEDWFAGTSMDEPACAWGTKMKAPLAISYLTSEDFYHAGQIAFIRLATDPSWDYYRAIRGVEEGS